MHSMPLGSDYLSKKQLADLLKKSILFIFILSVFFVSYYFSNFDMAGDQVHYHKAYEKVKGFGYFKAMAQYRTVIFSFEPIHFSVVWIASNLGLSKSFFMSILNTMFVFLCYKYLTKRKFKFGYIILLLFTNYYLYVMYFTLEKLKVAFILLMVFLLYKDKFKKPLLLFLLPVFTHFQMALLYFAAIAAKYIKFSKKIVIRVKRTPRYFLYAIAFITFALIVRILFSSFIMAKVLFYFKFSRGEGFKALINLAVIFMGTYFCTDRKKEVVIFYIIFSFFILLLGSDRLNMFVYFGFLYYSRPERMLTKLMILSTAVYLQLKGITYLTALYIYAN